jgi:hypothetical protein
LCQRFRVEEGVRHRSSERSGRGSATPSDYSPRSTAETTLLVVPAKPLRWLAGDGGVLDGSGGF